MNRLLTALVVAAVTLLSSQAEALTPSQGIAQLTTLLNQASTQNTQLLGVDDNWWSNLSRCYRRVKLAETEKFVAGQTTLDQGVRSQSTTLAAGHCDAALPLCTNASSILPQYAPIVAQLTTILNQARDVFGDIDFTGATQAVIDQATDLRNQVGQIQQFAARRASRSQTNTPPVLTVRQQVCGS